MSNKWLMKLGLGIAVLITASQANADPVFAAPEQNFGDTLEDKFEEEAETEPVKENDADDPEVSDENHMESFYLVEPDDAYFGELMIDSVQLHKGYSDNFVSAKKAMYEGMLNWEESIDLSECPIPQEDLMRLYYNTLYSYPELFYAMVGCNYYMSEDGYVTEILPVYEVEKYSKADQEALRAKGREIMSLVNEDWTDLEKALFLHDYIVQHVEYEKTTPHYNHTAYEALVKGIAVCDGYAGAYDYLLSLAGIDSEMILSDEMGHAWNLVCLDGEYYYVDTTWDEHATRFTRNTYCCHDNFLLTRQEMEVQKHTATDWYGPRSGRNVYKTFEMSDNYTNAFWKDVDGALPIDGDQTAYCDGDKIHIYDLRRMKEIAAYDYQQDDWADLGSGDSEYGSGYTILSVLDGVWYYTVSDGIYRLNADGTSERVYTITDEERAAGRIYGMMTVNDKLYYELAPAPDADTVKEGYFSISYEENKGNNSIVKDASGKLVYYKDGEMQSNYSGMVYADDNWYYVEKGYVSENKTGFADYQGSKFVVVKGMLETNANGLVQDPDNEADWYYCAAGQVQTQYTGLAEYNGAWFYINKGKLDTTLADYVEYDGGLFYVAAGRIMKEVNGLAKDPDGPDWYYLAEGQAQIQYTGLAFYDGEWFYVVDGKLAADYTGNVEYDGAVFYVENGMVK